MDTLRSGDVLVVWRLDRLGRSLRNLIELVGALEEQKGGFRSLQESMDTSSSGGRLIFHVFGALAEFERNLIRERTNAGLIAARARGRRGGRPKRLNDKRRSLAVQLYRDGKHSVEEVCQMMGISKPTLYSYVRDEPSI
jgi:DNA invertase Pin-like site-specific DNA recombinase